MTFRQNLIKLKYTIKEAMKVFSQNNEQQVIIRWFSEYLKSNLLQWNCMSFLDVGANDGKSLSNTHALALLGASGVCVEPSPVAFKALKELYKDNHSIHCIEAAIGDYIGAVAMQISGEHLGKGDTSLLSTLDASEYEKWKPTTEFTPMTVQLIDVPELLRLSPYKTFDFISIDAEGFDLTILSQMNLTELGCKLICLEWQSDKLTRDLMMSYCANHGLTKLLLQNGENIILCKPTN